MVPFHDEIAEILGILNSLLKWEVEEEREGEWGEFLGEDWFLGGGDEEFGDDGFFLGGVRGGWVNFFLNIYNF